MTQMTATQMTGQQLPPAIAALSEPPGRAGVLPPEHLEAFERFQRGLPMTARHVAIVAAVTVAGVACAVHRGRLRRRSMVAQAGFHPADVSAWLWGRENDE
jgi:hypothetical protein